MTNNYEQKTPFRERLEQLIGDEGPYAWAKRVGIPRSGFWRIWTEDATPQKKTIAKIVEATGVSADWLLHGRGEPPQQVAMGVKKPPATPAAAVEQPAEEAISPGAAAFNAAVNAPVNLALLEDSIKLVEALILTRHLILPPDKKARLITLIYDYCLNKGQRRADQATVARFVDLFN